MDKHITKIPHGTIVPPSSKSVTHRAIICAGLSAGTSVIKNVSQSEDIDATIACKRGLGAEIIQSGNVLQVTGGKYKTNTVLDCGESGTTLRLLIPVAAALTGSAVFKGRGRLMQRPLTPYIDAMRNTVFDFNGDFLKISGRLVPGEYRVPGDVSSQFISGLLTALPLLDGNSEIVLTTGLESASYVKLTIETLALCGIEIDITAKGYRVNGGQSFKAFETTIEADYSQAAFFLIAGALGCECEVRGLAENTFQGDKKIIEILRASGVGITLTPDGGIKAEPAKRLYPQTIDASDIPDLVPPVAALFAFCEGTSRITGASRLRYKESDRLASVTGALKKLGADIEHDDNSITIHGKPMLTGGVAESGNDHRIAMMCAVAAVRCRNLVTVKNAECAAKSYPGFWEDFERIEKNG